MDVDTLGAHDAGDAERVDEARARLLHKRRIVLTAVAAVAYFIQSGVVAERLYAPDVGARRLLFDGGAEPVVRKTVLCRKFEIIPTFYVSFLKVNAKIHAQMHESRGSGPALCRV